MLAEGGQAGEQLQEPRIPVVQVDPHGDRQAEAQVEAGAAVLVQVVLQLVGVFNDVHGDEGDAAGPRVDPSRALDEHLVQVEAQEVNLSVIRLFVTHRHQVLVKGFAQFLKIKKDVF